MSDQVREVKQKVDIVSVIGSRLDLKPAGKYHKGLCPFHSEKSPSFYVSDEMQIFKCFGCGKSGDVFTFLQEYEGMSFREVLEDLAQKVGVVLESQGSDKNEKIYKEMLQILNLSNEFYGYLLAKHKIGKNARSYLKQRNITPATISYFGLGFAPNAWNTLEKYLVGKKGFSREAVTSTGLLIQKETSSYDRFRNRIMFPLTNFRGQVVGFSGRVLDAETKEAKYINTPETLLYHKRELLFGINQARSAIRKKDQVIIVEGEFDVISSVQAGVAHVVAIKGSALTQEQLQLLLRLTKNIVLCLDADSAGDAATKRGIELADSLGMNVSVLQLEEGKDPDELARTQPQKWKKAIKDSISIYSFYIKQAFGAYSSSTGVGKKQITDELIPILSRITHPVEQTHYIKEVAQGLKVSEALISSEIERFQRIQNLAKAKGQNLVKKVEEEVAVVPNQRELLERKLWNSWLQLNPKDSEELKLQFLEVNWNHPGLKRLAQHLRDYYQSHKNFSVDTFSKDLSEELVQLLGQLYVEDVSLVEGVTIDEVKNQLMILQKHALREEIHQISDEIGELEANDSLPDSDQVKLDNLRQLVSQKIIYLKQL